MSSWREGEEFKSKDTEEIAEVEAGKRHAQFLQTIAALLRILRKCTWVFSVHFKNVEGNFIVEMGQTCLVVMTTHK